MINIKLKLPKTQNFDKFPYISACRFKTVIDIKLNMYCHKEEKISFSFIYNLLFLDMSNKCKYRYRLFDKLLFFGDLLSRVTVCVCVCAYVCEVGKLTL